MIAGRHNRTLKDIRRLRRSKGDHVLLEGTKLIGEALAAGLALETVVATADFLASAAGRQLAATLPGEPLVVDPAWLDELADSDSPRGILAVARLPRGGVESLPRRPGGIYLYLEGLQDPGNLGALARVAEAAGAAGMALAPGTAHPNHPRAQRAAAGSLLRLPVAVGVEPAALEAHLAAIAGSAGGAGSGIMATGSTGALGSTPRWLVLVPRGGVDLYGLGPAGGAGASAPWILAVGAEGPGVSADLEARADLRLTIPIAPPVESLNATVAAALALFELRRRRRAMGAGGDIADPGL